MSSNTVTIVISAVTLCLVAAVAAQMPRTSTTESADDVAARLAAIEKRLDSVDELRAEIRAIAERAEKRSAAAERRVVSPVPAVSPAGVPTAGDAPANAGSAKDDTGALADAVVEKIEKRMTEKAAKVAGREYSDDGRWKAPIDELAEELSLDDAAKAEAKRIFDGVKDRGYALLKVQRLDGGTLLDDFVSALKNGPDAETATREFFKRIVSERVPGTDETYLAGFLEIGVDADRELASKLDPATMRKLRALRVDYLDVKTGYDPTGDYVRARLQ